LISVTLAIDIGTSLRFQDSVVFPHHPL